MNTMPRTTKREEIVVWIMSTIALLAALAAILVPIVMKAREKYLSRHQPAAITDVSNTTPQVSTPQGK